MFGLRRLFRSSEQGTRETPPTSFQELVTFGKYLAERNPPALRDYIKALARPRQWEHLTYILSRELHDSLDPVSWTNLFFVPEGPAGNLLFELPRRVPREAVIDLTSEVVLANPWHRKQLLNSLASIGGQANPWQQDRINHRVELLDPLGICLVHGGNHSITAGILKGEGQIRVDEVTDLRPLLGALETDGEVFRTVQGIPAGRVVNTHYAAIFQLAKLIEDA